ncbi:MAG TPA: LysR family transcriptional regulator [Acidimicrobiales bacterium]|nr:LysR family transcriptional regulator [Acidimicrobiales bacterium]
MDLKHLQALIGIADCGSFSAAAESIGTVQSNISAHVARIERELDVILVDRSSGHLTEEGEVVVARARRMMVELDAMAADVVSLRQEVSGTVRAGVIGTTGRWLVPQLFARLRERHPHIRLNVTDGTNTTLEPQLVSGRLDLAVVSLPVRSDDLVATPLFGEDLMLVVPVGHPLAPAASTVPADASGDAQATGPTDGPVDPLPLTALTDLELLLPIPGTALRNEIDAAARKAGVTLRPSIELDGMHMLASLTFDGYGPAILPAAALPDHLRSEFRMVALEGFPRRGVGVALRTRGLPSAPTRVLIETLHDVVAGCGTTAGLHPFGTDRAPDRWTGLPPVPPSAPAR